MSNFCYVVNNPTDWLVSYNLPVLIVSFNQSHSQPPSFHNPGTKTNYTEILRKLDPTLGSRSRAGQVTTPLARPSATAEWQTPFRWHWWDGRKFEPYPDTINSLLEEAYTRRECEYRTPPIVRYLDDQPQEYVIQFRSRSGADLSKMLQINAKTRYSREIRRQPQQIQRIEEARWTYSDGNQWVKFDSSVQLVIETAFIAYISSTTSTSNKCVVSFPGRPEKYEIDYLRGTQRNVDSGTLRSIRRVNNTRVLPREEATIDVDLPPTVNIGHLSTRLTQELTNMVTAASLSIGTGDRSENAIRVSIGWDGRTSQVAIAMTGSAVTICSLLVARTRSLLLELHGVTVPLRRIHVNGPSGKQMLQNPRLLQLVSANQPQVWSTRDDVMLQVAHTIIWKGQCPIYGGFVRDWVLLGKSANDIDVTIHPPQTNVVMIASILQELLDQKPSLNLSLNDKGQKGAAHCLQISAPFLKKVIEIDLVDPSGVPFTPPGVDSDVGNVLVSRDGLQKKATRADGGRISLEKIVRHAMKKEFVFFYDTSTNDAAVMRRLRKCLDRQWTCISPIPVSCMAQLEESQRKFIRPKSKYAVNWWRGTFV